MKKIMLFVVTLLLCFTIEEIAYAGNLNEQELAIIEAACEAYEYNGKKYRADQKYIDKLIDYLSQDNIDITAEDKDLLIQIAYANIELGIKDGYLHPIDDLSNQEEQNNSAKTNTEDTIREALGTVGIDIADVQSYIPALIDDANINTTQASDTASNTQTQASDTKDNAINGVNAVEPKNSTDTTGSTAKPDDTRSTTTSTTPKPDDTRSTTPKTDDTRSTTTNTITTGIIGKHPDDTTSTTPNPDAATNVTISRDDSTYNFTKDANTSFNLERALLIMIGLVVLIILGVFIIKKNKYLYHAHE